MNCLNCDSSNILFRIEESIYYCGHCGKVVE